MRTAETQGAVSGWTLHTSKPGDLDEIGQFPEAHGLPRLNHEETEVRMDHY